MILKPITPMKSDFCRYKNRYWYVSYAMKEEKRSSSTDERNNFQPINTTDNQWWSMENIQFEKPYHISKQMNITFFVSISTTKNSANIFIIHWKREWKINLTYFTFDFQLIYISFPFFKWIFIHVLNEEF